jgi:hypothetical protein
MNTVTVGTTEYKFTDIGTKAKRLYQTLKTRVKHDRRIGQQVRLMSLEHLKKLFLVGKLS